jgi:prepilin-type N-terminal cleavage/methylation domain-containing protein
MGRGSGGVESMMMIRTHRRRRTKLGFTLVEMMVAMTILGFGMLGVAAAQMNTMRGSRSGIFSAE